MHSFVGDAGPFGLSLSLLYGLIKDGVSLHICFSCIARDLEQPLTSRTGSTVAATLINIKLIK